jgi:hypothetical protein
MRADLFGSRPERPCDTLSSTEPHRCDANCPEPKSWPLQIETRASDEAFETQFHVVEFDVVGARLRHPDRLPDPPHRIDPGSIKWNKEKHRAAIVGRRHKRVGQDRGP